MAASESAAQPLTIVIQHRGRPGFLAGVLACIFGVLGIFVSGILFVPLAAICSIVGLWRGIAGKSPEGIGTSLLSGFLSVVGFAVSPTLWLFTGALFLTHEIATATPPAAVSPAQLQAQKDVQFASSVESLVQRMQRFDGMAETDATALPAYRSRMQSITDKMADYLRRERALGSDFHSAGTRGQLYVAVIQGSVATDQLRVQVQPLESEFQAKAGPLVQLVSQTANNCRSAIRSGDDSSPKLRACRDLSEAVPIFARDMRNLQAELADYSALDARTKDTQQRLIDAAEAAQ